MIRKILNFFKKDTFPFEIEDPRAEISKKDTSGTFMKSPISDVNPYLIQIHLNTIELGQQYRRYLHFYAMEELKKENSEYVIITKKRWKHINWDKLSMMLKMKLSH